jgi:hypothetical protein
LELGDAQGSLAARRQPLGLLERGVDCNAQLLVGYDSFFDVFFFHGVFGLVGGWWFGFPSAFSLQPSVFL